MLATSQRWPIRWKSEGLLRRVDHPTDRRATLLELTDEGRAAADESLVPRLVEISRLFDELSPTARAELRNTLTTLVASMDSPADSADGS